MKPTAATSTLSTKIYNAYTALVGSMIAMRSPAKAAGWVYGRRQFRAFAAGSARDADRNFNPRLTSGDADVKRAYKLVAARCRDQAENNSLISGGIDRICNNVVRSGIYPKFKFRTADDKLDRLVNARWRRSFARWARYCDITGHDSYGALQRLGLRHMWSDGQYLIHRVYDNSINGVVPLRLELIEFDQMDTLVDGVQANGNLARRGIEFDPATGRPVMYHILDHHPGDYLTGLGARSATRKIPAADIIHVWDRRRISQFSGIAWMAAVVMEAFRMEDFRHITQDAARIQATFAAFLKSAFPDFRLGAGVPFGGQTAPPKPGETGTTEAPTEVRHNIIQGLPPGTEVQFAAPSHPGNNYEPFVKDSQRWQSVGLGMSFEAYTNNYTDSSYASARSGSLEERLSYRSQQQFLEEKVNRHILAWYIEAAYLSGLAPVAMPGYARDPYMYHEMAEGQYPGWGWVDPNNDANASEKEIDLVLDTRRNKAAQRGLDWDEIMDEQMEEEIRMLELEELRAQRRQIKEEKNAAPTE